MRCANFIVKKPMVIGHECAGIIEEVGSEVKNLVVGDRVALEPGISCNRCSLCRNGQYNLCREMKFFGSPPTNGSLANQVIALLKTELLVFMVCWVFFDVGFPLAWSDHLGMMPGLDNMFFLVLGGPSFKSLFQAT